MQNIDLIIPDWPAPRNVCCISTTRQGGFSKGKYSTLNLGDHVGDIEEHVYKNRLKLLQKLNLSTEPMWLEQQHSNKVVFSSLVNTMIHKADAAYTVEKEAVCVVLTADCLPVVFCDDVGSCVAIAHAGWRGLLRGVLENTLSAMPVNNSNILCWLGAAIGPDKFEVGDDVKNSFVDINPHHESAFILTSKNKYLANIYTLAKNILIKSGVKNIYGGDRCTFSEKDKFFSHRRDGKTGRMATMIWINH